MMIQPTQDGGRVIQGDTPYGRFRFNVDHDGALIDYEFEMRTPEQPAPRLSPGSLLTTGIKLITGEEPGPNCACKARARRMDEWGWMKCWRERRAIATWIAEEARKRGHDMDDVGAMQFVRAAWKEIRQRRKDEATRTP